MKDFLLSHALAVAAFIFIIPCSLGVWSNHDQKMGYKRATDVYALLIDCNSGKGRGSSFGKVIYNHRKYNVGGYSDCNMVGMQVLVKYDQKSDSMFAILENPDEHYNNQMGSSALIILVCGFL